MSRTHSTAVFAAGCFWQVEQGFRETEGVVGTEVGYTGGHVDQPGYEQVCTGRTGHAEAVRVWYDPDKVSYEQLLEVFWEAHDPTQANRQGPDVGTQYRSAIFYLDQQQRTVAEASKSQRENSGRYRHPVVTEITPLGPFFPAEMYHQQYLAKRGHSTSATTLRA